MICTLCGIFSKYPLIESERPFCCAGCRAVYKIIETRNETFHKEHPLYLEALKEGVISNAPNQANDIDHGERIVLEISGMGCPSCAEVIGYFLNRKEGVKAKVDYTTDLALIEYDPMKIGVNEIFEKIKSIGYEAFYLNDKKKKDRRLLLELGIAAFSALNLMMVAYPLYAVETGGATFAYISLFFTLPIVFFSALPFYKRAVVALRAQIYGMDLLVTISVLSAFILSTWNLYQGIYILYYETLSIIVAFLLFGKWIERQAKLAGKERFYEMMRHLPQKVRLENGETRLLKEIKVGERIVLNVGEMVPVKVSIVKGSLWISEQAISGESAPKFNQEEDLLNSGAIVESGQAIAEVKEEYANSLIHKMIEACELSFNRRTKDFTLLNAFVPTIIALAVGAFFIFGFERGLSVLLISCPCAIGLAAPLVRSKLLKMFAEKGALVRNFVAFDRLADAELFIFDKTGTLTEGKLRLIKQPMNRAIVKGLARFSTHPLAKALANLEGPGIDFDEIQEYVGKGIYGVKDGVKYYMGSSVFLSEFGINSSYASEHTHIILAVNGAAIECLEFEDSIRTNLDLPEPRILLSGDQELAVSKVARALGFKKWYSGKTPLEKEAIIRSCPENSVYIGDGLNDAPSLAASSCGIAVGEAMGITQAAADIVLVNSHLNELKSIIKLAKTGKRTIRQNFFWAFVYNVLCIPLAMAGFLTPIIATIAMILSSLFVIGNSLKRF